MGNFEDAFKQATEAIREMEGKVAGADQLIKEKKAEAVRLEQQLVDTRKQMALELKTLEGTKAKAHAHVRKITDLLEQLRLVLAE